MRDMRLYWRRVRETEAQLRSEFGDVVYASTLENPDTGVPAGRVSICSPEVAGRLIVDHKVSVATPGEIEAYRLHHTREAERLSAQNRRLAAANATEGDPNAKRYQL